MAERPVVILHGWSDTSDTFEPLARLLRARLGRAVSIVSLADYVSMEDEVRFDDVAEAMDVAWRRHGCRGGRGPSTQGLRRQEASPCTWRLAERDRFGLEPVVLDGQPADDLRQQVAVGRVLPRLAGGAPSSRRRRSDSAAIRKGRRTWPADSCRRSSASTVMPSKIRDASTVPTRGTRAPRGGCPPRRPDRPWSDCSSSPPSRHRSTPGARRCPGRAPRCRPGNSRRVSAPTCGRFARGEP